VPACSECNRRLGSRLLVTVPDRARYLLGRNTVKWKKLLNSPDWDEDEIEQLGGNLRRRIRAIMAAKRFAVQRLSHLELVASMDDDYLRP